MASSVFIPTYLGINFASQTDHQPLITLFNEDKAVPAQASSCIQRWALLLASYEYTIVYRSTTKHSNADAMSRLLLPKTTPVPAELVLMIENLDEAPISAKQMATWTQRDVVLSRVLEFIMLGWPKEADDDPKPRAAEQGG